MDERKRSGRGSAVVRLVVEPGRAGAPETGARVHRRSDRIAGAVAVLHGEPATWFYEPRDARGVFDADILEALGRLGTEARIRDTARALAALPPMPGAEARSWIRAWSEAAPGAAREVPGMVRRLAAAIESHRREHPAAGWDAVCEALAQLLEVAEEARDAAAPDAAALPVAS